MCCCWVCLNVVFHEILKLHEEVSYEQAVKDYFSDFSFITAHTLRGWVAEFDRSTNSNSSSSQNVDETKESVRCHDLFNIQITTIHQRIDQQTNELKNTANKLRNRFNEDRAFERDMSSGGGLSRGTGGSTYSRGSGGSNFGAGAGKGKGGGQHQHNDLVHTPFNNPINSRDPRNQSVTHDRNDLQAPSVQNSR